MDLRIYHGNINKQTCEKLLSKKGKDGTFLIRDSETIQGALCLCVYKKKIVYTYRILQSHTGQYTLQTSTGVQEKFFKTLEDLVKNYKKHGQGLAMHLCHGMKRESLPQQKDVQDETPDYEELEDSSDYVAVLPS